MDKSRGRPEARGQQLPHAFRSDQVVTDVQRRESGVEVKGIAQFEQASEVVLVLGRKAHELRALDHQRLHAEFLL